MCNNSLAILILPSSSVGDFKKVLFSLSKLCKYIFIPSAEFAWDNEDILSCIVPIEYEQRNKSNLLASATKLAVEKECSHLMTLELSDNLNEEYLFKELNKLLGLVKERPNNIIIGKRNFNSPCYFALSLERLLSSFCMRVQTGAKVFDLHSPIRIYPLDFLDFINLNNPHLNFEVELLVRAAWAGYAIHEVDLYSLRPWKVNNLSYYVGLLILHIRLIMRALVPIPFSRPHVHKQKTISLKHPIEALQTLMSDPFNRSTPRDLCKTASIAIAVLTVPAPIIQSVALLLFIGWFKLNRLCALAMIPFTWPPWLPAMAILVGYRLRHGHWLTEFNMQTLGYEIDQRLWEWVIGSLALTPVFALCAGIVVGGLAYMVASRADPG